MRDDTRCFAYKMPKFVMETKISTRQVVEFTLDETCTIRGIITRCDNSMIRDFGFTCMRNLIVCKVM